MDVIYLGLSALLAALILGLAQACARLEEKKQ